ncbi:MAG: DUF4199 family protein [Bacteroidota bacterium]
MIKLILRIGLLNTLSAAALSALVYRWTPVHPLGQFRFLLGVVTLAWLIVGMNALRKEVFAGDLKVTYGLLFSAGVGLVSAISFGLVAWLLCAWVPGFWQAYLEDQVRNLEQASGILNANYSAGTLDKLRREIQAQSPMSLMLRISFFRFVWHLLAGLWVGIYFRK